MNRTPLDMPGAVMEETGRKEVSNPVLRKEEKNPWEREKVAACQVLKWKNYYYMFYIEFLSMWTGQPSDWPDQRTGSAAGSGIRPIL